MASYPVPLPVRCRYEITPRVCSVSVIVAGFMGNGNAGGGFYRSCQRFVSPVAVLPLVGVFTFRLRPRVRRCQGGPHSASALLYRDLPCIRMAVYPYGALLRRSGERGCGRSFARGAQDDVGGRYGAQCRRRGGTLVGGILRRAAQDDGGVKVVLGCAGLPRLYGRAAPLWHHAHPFASS